MKGDIKEVPKGIYPELRPEGFDVLVTNPPFRKIGTGKISPYDERAVARHEISLSLSELLDTAKYLLKNRGRFFMIYHPFRLTELISRMRECSLEPKRIRFVHPGHGKEATMVLVDAVKSGSVELKIEYPLIVYDNNGNYSDETLKMFEL